MTWNAPLTASIAIFVWLFQAPPLLLAQESVDSTASMGSHWYQKGEAFFNDGKLDSAAIAIERAMPLFRKAEEWEPYIKAINALATLSYYLNEFDNYRQYAQLSLAEVKRYLPSSHPLYAESLNNLGGLYYEIGNYDKAIDLLKQDLKVKEAIDEAPIEMAYTFQNLSKNYGKKGEFSQAIEYLKKCLEYRLDTLPREHYLIANTYRDIAEAYKDQGQLDTARAYYREGLKLFDALPEENIRITKRKISTFHGLAQIWMSKQQLTKANQQIEKALQLQQKLSWRTPTSYQIQGEIATQAGQIDKAVRLLTKALTLALQPEHKMGAPSKARILIRLAQAQSLQKQHKKALESYNQALTYLRPGYVPLTTGIPPVDQLLDKPRALEVLNGKASTYWQLYLQSEDRQMLQSAQEYYLAATNLVKDIRQGYLTVDAKNTLASKSVSIYEGALLATWALYRQTDNQDHLRTAFQLAESNKALLLLEALNEQNARGFAGIPDSLLTCQKDLRIDLAYYQRKLLETQIRKPSKTKAIKSYESLIFELNKQLEELTDRFGQDYPRYQQLRSNTQPVALQQLQTVLQTKDERLLEYFYGDSLLFVFVVGPNAIEMYKLTNEGLSDKIDQFRQSLTAPASRQLNEQDFAAFTKQSHELYQLLVEKGLPELPDADGQIVIVPDHQLNYLPFGLLLVQPADPNQPTFKASAIDYLLNHCALSYEYSATLYCLSRNRVQPQHQASILGFAPDFEGPQLAQTVRDCNNVPLNQLNCNHQEVSQIAELLKGRPLLGGEANKQNFAAAVSGYQIIHMATHACLNSNTALLNRIYLTDGYLSVIDLNNLQLDAELAVLSACNTGSGQLLRGEGVMSLARSFMTAGCNSTLMSLWAVNDCTTSDIMLNFYKELEKGLPKNEALRQAKLQYIAQASQEYAHPYYWGAFLQFGNSRAMELQHRQPSSIWWMLALALGLVAVFFFFKSRS